jgi:hypothetical protein
MATAASSPSHPTASRHGAYSPGMYRARMSQGGQPTIAIYNDEP